MIFLIFLFLLACGSTLESQSSPAERQLSPIKEKDGSLFLHVPAGKYLIGSDDPDALLDEGPEFEQEIKEFYLQQFEISNQQYADFLNKTGLSLSDTTRYIGLRGTSARPSEIAYTGTRFRASFGYEDHPVATVNYSGARIYCEWLGGRLPTEFEWEAAAYDLRTLSWEEPEKEAQCHKEWSYGGKMPVVSIGTFSPSALGFYDLLGNVAEITSSEYLLYPSSQNLATLDLWKRKVIRGGDWNTRKEQVRATSRKGIRLQTRGFFEGGVGFRCAKDIP